jgi:subtilisin family serine protease
MVTRFMRSAICCFRKEYMTRRLHALAALVVGIALAQSATTGRAQQPGPEMNFVGNEVLVQFAAGASDGAKAAARGRIRGQRIEVVASARDGRGDLELLRIPPGLAVADAVRGIEADSAVTFAEPNWIYTHGSTSNDPYYLNGSLWGMYGDATSPANQYGSGAAAAWANGHVGLSNVYVGIIDEGVMPHDDFGTNVWVNPGETPGNGVDDDGNGYVDDVRGWDFDGGDNTTYDGNQDDHGTHVAGTIGALGGNSVGVAGMNWNVTMIPAKFLGRRGGSTADAIKALDYLIDLKSRYSLNLVATNNSWGGGGFSQALLDAINRGGNAGILFIAAAGNGGPDGVGDNNDTTPTYPSNYTCESSNGDCVIAVAAITSGGARASFSNYGLTKVDLGAPGSGIYSTVPAKNGASSYASYSGTSMATPHVTGAAALYASTHPGATAQQIKAAILGAATPTPSLTGRTVTGGRLNVSGF